MIRLKSGVRLLGIRPELTVILHVLDGVFTDAGYPLIVNHGMEGTHSNNSLHYAGCALDLSSWHISTIDEKRKIEVTGKRDTGPDCDFFLEDVGTSNEHYHVEYQPKKEY